MAPKPTTTTQTPPLKCTMRALFLSFSITSLLTFTLFFFLTRPASLPYPNPRLGPSNSLKVFIFNLSRSYNYDLLHTYWSLPPDGRISSDPDHPHDPTRIPINPTYPPYPNSPLIKQYSAEYWLLGDLLTPDGLKSGSFAKRVGHIDDADVVFVPFFATLSAEIQLGFDRSVFRKKVAVNGDYKRQKEVVEMVKKSDAWIRSGGRNFVFVVTDPVAMWHVKDDIAPSILLVVDFGGWHRRDSKSSNGSSSERIQHTQVSLLKDVIVPYTHLLPALPLSKDKPRHNLLYFKGAKHRHGGGVIREKLWGLLENEPRVRMEEGFPNATGMEQSIKGMRTSEFCLHPAGDTPTSCRLFDAIQSLCIPVIVSDHIELPFEGMIDYSEFSVFVSVDDALRPKWLVNHLDTISRIQRESFRRNMARYQPMFVYDNGYPGGIGPVPFNGAVNNIWKKVHQKLPVIREAVVRDRRKPPGVSIPLRCHCT